MKISIKLLHSKAKIPMKATDGSAGFDVFVPEELRLPSGYCRIVVPLGFAIDLPKNLCAKILPRSGHASKGMLGYRTKDCLLQSEDYFDADVLESLIDPDYKGQVHTIIRKADLRPMFLKAGTRIAQMTIEKLPEVEFALTEEDLRLTVRGEGGFGHTGID